MEKVGNVYPTLFEPQKFEKQGFREWEDILHNENSNCKSTTLAPPVATFKNELITGSELLNGNINTTTRTGYTPGGLWSKSTDYLRGDFVRIDLKGVNYYFVAKDNHTDKPPPDQAHWFADECSKTLSGCRLRWTAPLPIGAFPTSRRGGTE